MYMSVWRGELKPGMEAEATANAEEGLTPLARNAKGFIKFVSGLNRSTNQVVFISLWESAEDAAAVRDISEFHQWFSGLTQYYTVLPSREAFEVIFEI